MISNETAREALQGLTPQEREYALKILQELEQNGSSKSYEDLMLSEYKEVPVDIITFIKDPQYLGKAWHLPNGQCKLFPFWEEKLKELFPDNISTNYNTFIESGARGLGKAQPMDSPVLTKDGFKRMGDMQVGDSVYGVDGYTHKVIGVFPQGVMKTYRVSFSDGTSTLCCGEHLWGVYDCADNERYSVLTLNNIIQNGLKTENDFRYRIPVCSPVMFNHSRVPVHAESLAEEMFPRGSNGGYSGSIPNEYIYTDYVSRLKFIAKVIQNRLIIDDETGLAYVVGVNSSVYDSLQTLVQSVGGLLYREKGEINCRIMLPESAINYISSIIGRNLHDISFPVKYITDVEEVVEEECQCIYIDSAEHLYLTDNFIVTHNSEIAVSVMLYLMYRLMCMKNPYQSYNLKVTEKFCFGFMNITKQLAEEIGVSKFQETVQMSPWFMSHGTITGRTNLIWNPPDFINIIIGSQSSDVIGQPIFACLGADTVVMTDKGARMICDLVGERIRVQTVDDGMRVLLSDECTVLKTKETTEYYKIELEDGTKITCTPEHRFMTVYGDYIYASEIEAGCALAQFKSVSQDIFQKVLSIERVVSETTVPFYDAINANPYNNFLIKTNEGTICSHNCFFDEISFIKNQDVEMQKKKALDMIDTALGGMTTRFTNRGKNPTLLVLASSKRSEKSFLEEHTKKKAETDKLGTLVVDEPVWNVRPASEYSGKRFWVALGNRFLNSEVLPLDTTEDVLDYWRGKGYKLIDVPIEYRAKFLEDIDRALCDYAGVSSSDLTTYISGVRLLDCVNKTIKNPFTKEVITVGNALEDTQQYYDFFDIDQIPPQLMSRPLYIHLDMSMDNDKTGIAGVWVVKKKPSTNGNPDSQELFYRLAFSVAIKAPKGHQISFEKNRQFIYWLKKKGFNIKGVSSDTYQSGDMKQQLLAKGYAYETVSVDRVSPNDHVCLPYQYFKSTIYEQRIEMYPTSLLMDEIVGLEKNATNGKIDHSPRGINSKDISDAVCGAVWNASQHAEEFAYNFGEDLPTVQNVNGDIPLDTKQMTQLTIDFEQELNKIFGDFRSTPVVTPNSYESQGIFVW